MFADVDMTALNFPGCTDMFQAFVLESVGRGVEGRGA